MRKIRCILCFVIVVISFQVKAQNNNEYCTIYSAKESRFLDVIDSIMSKTPLHEAQEFVNKKYFECNIFQNNCIDPLNINLKKDEYIFIIWGIVEVKNKFPYVTKYFIKYNKLYYGMNIYIPELFGPKLYVRLKKDSFIGLGCPAWYFYIKNGILYRYKFDPVGYDDAPDSVKYVINKDCYIPLWD